nr:MAG TPA: Minor structural protein [Caudoviricetes sp.]
MRNTSSKYKELIKGVREFCAKIIINYADGSSQTLTELQDFKQLKFVDESSSSSEFEIGAAVIGEALITLNNRTGKFDNKTFYGAHISAYTGILVDEKPELLEMGHYIVDEPVSPGISIALTAYDNMILLDKAYVPGITYPATLAQIAQDACVQCGVILESLQFPRSSYVVATAPTDVTCREVMAAVAQLAGCYVKARPNGRIAITWYADAASNTISTLYSKNVCTDDVTITGITVISGETTAKSGADGYRLAISDNILLDEEKAQETADYLGNKLIGLTFRPLSVSCQSDPSIEAGDRIAVKDEKGNTYQTVVTSTTFAVLEAQKIACNAASPTVNGGQRLSETSKAIIASRKYTNEAVEYERTERESAIEDLNKQLDESPGLYCTPQVQEDGSTIYYLHEKAELSDSLIVWKYTATAFGASTDGGKTYPYGFDVSGKAILDRIYVIGLDAKYIKTGTLDADIVQIINLHLKDISDSTGVTLDVTLNGITADVSSKYTELDGKISDNSASIKLLPDSITSTVKTTYIDPLTTRMESAEASIKINEQGIESKVSKNSVISSINQSSESVTISASKINLKGAVTISSLDSDLKISVNNANTASSTLSSWSYDNNMTTIDGGKVAAHTITAEQIAIGDFTNYATVTENDPSTLLSDQTIVSSETMGDWIENVDKKTGLRYMFVSQRFCINSFRENDILNFDFCVWCGQEQSIVYGIWFYDKNGQYINAGNWQGAAIPAQGDSFTHISGKVKVPMLPANTKYYCIGIEFGKYGTTSRNCVQKIKVTKISGYLQIGEGYIDSAGPFKIGCMQSVGELNDDVEFKHAIFVDYGIELLAGNDGATPYIDFHTEAPSHDKAAYDYTARLQNTQKSWITFYGLSDGKNTPAGCTVQSAQFRGTLVNDSDRRLKQDIADLSIDEVLKEISKYRPVSYKYINGVDDNVHHGLIAQEAQEIAQWGLVDDRGEYLAINYIDLISDLIKTTQYSLKEIEKLKTIIDN